VDYGLLNTPPEPKAQKRNGSTTPSASVANQRELFRRVVAQPVDWLLRTVSLPERRSDIFGNQTVPLAGPSGFRGAGPISPIFAS
jgi:hypothetical protein